MSSRVLPTTGNAHVAGIRNSCPAVPRDRRLPSLSFRLQFHVLICLFLYASRLHPMRPIGVKFYLTVPPATLCASPPWLNAKQVSGISDIPLEVSNGCET